MYADVVFHEQPRWSRQPGRRLALNFLPASLIIASVLMVIRLPVIGQTQPLSELFVRILIDDIEEVLEPPPVQDLPDEPVPPTSATSAPQPTAPVTTDSREPVDWFAQIPDAAEEFLNTLPREYSINPNFDEKRRIAAEKFRPSEAPARRPIWENVEKDTLGRTVLVSGDCQRVLDDPNVGSREAFLTFGQFITTCAFYKRTPQELGFVKEIQNRREGQVRYGHPAAE